MQILVLLLLVESLMFLNLTVPETGCGEDL